MVKGNPTSNPAPLPGGEILVDVLVEQMQQQPWWQRFSNTVTTAVGAVIALVWVAASAGLDVPAEITTGIAAVIPVLTVLGVLRTRNGITPRGVARVAEVTGVDYQGRHRRADT